ncbi:MAG: hypothetical protein E3J72_12420 [Planctomycetota bacterium]|nr:MAG: hypothetical protein E3J72_12420 [Planctomycetota bacterium]
MPLEVSDAISNAPEQIKFAAEALCRSDIAFKVFDAIYKGKKKAKTVEEIVGKTKLTRKQVLTHGNRLAQKHIVKQIGKYGNIAYEKIDFFYPHKREILRLAKDPKKREAYTTKRNPKSGSSGFVNIRIQTKRTRTEQITVDDIGSFKKIGKVATSKHIPNTVSERKFKRGIKNILGEHGEFKDWGGEKNDLYTTRLRMDGKRRVVAFAFKGPGTRGKLVPGKLGKNGDQIQRLFEADADVFIIQYWRDIAESVIQQMFQLAIAKSAMTGRKVSYGIIDGYDSNRIFKAYRKKF